MDLSEAKKPAIKETQKSVAWKAWILGGRSVSRKG